MDRVRDLDAQLAELEAVDLDQLNAVAARVLNPEGFAVSALGTRKGRDIRPESLSARNILMGRVARIVPGVVNDEVIIDLPGGSTVTAINTSESVRRLGIAPGDEVAAIFKASSVLLAVV